MTREEIKDIPELVNFMLDKSVLVDTRIEVRKRLEKVCDLAIKALEQKPCDNAISRQAVLDQTYLWSKDEFLRVTNPFDYLRKKINSLPPVTPQPKYEDIAKAFQFGLAFGFGEKHDEMDKVIDEIKKVITP